MYNGLSNLIKYVYSTMYGIIPVLEFPAVMGLDNTGLHLILLSTFRARDYILN